MLMPLMFLLLQPAVGTIPDSSGLPRDRAFGPTAVSGMDMRPVKPRDCQSEAEVRRAVAQVKNGEPGDCFVRDASAFSRYKG